jgi:ABC-type oligopeptide transport system substrate-binding subunit
MTDEKIRQAVAFAIDHQVTVDARFLADLIAQSEGVNASAQQIAGWLAEAAVAARVPVML